jgi:hypothetical protein
VHDSSIQEGAPVVRLNNTQAVGMVVNLWSPMIADTRRFPHPTLMAKVQWNHGEYTVEKVSDLRRLDPEDIRVTIRSPAPPVPGS